MVHYFIPIDLANTVRELKEFLQALSRQNGMFHDCYNACIYYFNTVQIREEEKKEAEEGRKRRQRKGRKRMEGGNKYYIFK